MAGDASSRTFAPPTWLRWFNLPAALVIAFAVLALSAELLPELVLWPAALLVLCTGVVLGLRAVRAQVVVDPVSVVYQGLTRTVSIPRSSLVSFTDHARGWALLFGDAPAVGWLDSQDREHTTRLWVFAMRPESGQIGSRALRSVREELAGVLTDAVGQADRDRKHH